MAAAGALPAGRARAAAPGAEGTGAVVWRRDHAPGCLLLPPGRGEGQLRGGEPGAAPARQQAGSEGPGPALREAGGLGLAGFAPLCTEDFSKSLKKMVGWFV